MNEADVIAAWDKADPVAIHPLRRISEEAYWDSGVNQAVELARILPKDGRILDYGCGDGRVAIPLHNIGFNVVAADSSPKMLAALKARAPEVTTTAIGGDDFPGGFDAAYCLAVLIHHDYATATEIITNLASAVDNGGLLILDWPTSENPYERKSWIEVTTWSKENQQALANELGLKLVLNSGLPFSVFEVV